MTAYRCSVIALTALFVALSCNGQRNSHLARSTRLFEHIRTELALKTTVPLELPSEWGFANDPQLTAHLMHATTDQYEIEIGWAPDCAGEHRCEDGRLLGTRNQLPVKSGNWKTVVLSHHIRGHYLPFDCGAYCGNSYIRWSQANATYEIGLKAGTLKSLKQLADSAIASSAVAR